MSAGKGPDRHLRNFKPYLALESRACGTLRYLPRTVNRLPSGIHVGRRLLTDVEQRLPEEIGFVRCEGEATVGAYHYFEAVRVGRYLRQFAKRKKGQ